MRIKPATPRNGWRAAGKQYDLVQRVEVYHPYYPYPPLPFLHTRTMHEPRHTPLLKCRRLVVCSTHSVCLQLHTCGLYGAVLGLGQPPPSPCITGRRAGEAFSPIRNVRLYLMNCDTCSTTRSIPPPPRQVRPRTARRNAQHNARPDPTRPHRHWLPATHSLPLRLGIGWTLTKPFCARTCTGGTQA